MQHRRLRGKLGVKTNHRKALLRNLVRNLVLFKKIRTTLAKANAVSPLADRMITLARRADLHARRVLISKLGSSDIAAKLISEIAPHFKHRKGGYTRVLHLGRRPGDSAEMALVEFTETIELPKKEKKAKKEKKPKTPKAEEKVSGKAAEKKVQGEKAAPQETAVPEQKAPEKKEAEKRGGFLSNLRKFFKGEDSK